MIDILLLTACGFEQGWVYQNWKQVLLFLKNNVDERMEENSKFAGHKNQNNDLN